MCGWCRPCGEVVNLTHSHLSLSLSQTKKSHSTSMFLSFVSFLQINDHHVHCDIVLPTCHAIYHMHANLQICICHPSHSPHILHMARCCCFLHLCSICIQMPHALHCLCCTWSLIWFHWTMWFFQLPPYIQIQWLLLLTDNYLCRLWVYLKVYCLLLVDTYNSI